MSLGHSSISGVYSPITTKWAFLVCEANLSMCITYISVSIPTQCAVTGPQWQLASFLLCCPSIGEKCKM